MRISTKEEFETKINEASRAVADMMVQVSENKRDTINELSKRMLIDIGSYVFKIKGRYSLLYMYQVLFLVCIEQEYKFLSLSIKIDLLSWQCMMKPEILKNAFIKLTWLFENNSQYMSNERKQLVEKFARELERWFEKNEGIMTISSSRSDLVKRLYDYFNERMISQDQVKKVLACKVQRLLNGERPRSLLIKGPTGAGKSYLLELLQEFSDENNLNLTVIYEDASRLTQEGFSGRNFSDVIKKIQLKNTKENGKILLFLDEVDKLIPPSYDGGGGNVSAKVLSQLLTALGNTDENCKDVLFVLAGAFSSIDEEEKINRKIGFGTEIKDSIVSRNVLLKDKLIAYGCFPEFLARLDIVSMERLTPSELNKILILPCNAIQRMILDFRKSGVELVLTERFKERLIEQAYNMNMGARSIMSVFQNICDKHTIEFEVYTRENLKEIIIDEEILYGEEPIFICEDEDTNKKDEFTLRTVK